MSSWHKVSVWVSKNLLYLRASGACMCFHISYSSDMVGMEADILRHTQALHELLTLELLFSVKDGGGSGKPFWNLFPFQTSWVTAFGRAGLALPFRFSFPDWPVLLLGLSAWFLVVRMQNSSFIILAADLLMDSPFGFWYTFSMCSIIQLLKHTILAISQLL